MTDHNYFQTEEIDTVLDSEPSLSQRVVSEYFSLLQENSILPEIKNLFILGSYGRLDAKPSSDMDVWITLDSTEDIQQIYNVAKKELAVRQDISSRFQLPNIALHLASFFDPEEAMVYREVYATRVGIPYSLGEHITLHPKEFCRIENKSLAIDWVVSIEDFLERERLEGKDMNMKWKRRIIQEYFSYLFASRIKTKDELDAFYMGNFVNSGKDFLEFVREGVDFTKKEYSISTEDLDKVRNFQTIATTLEKVRWEFITCIDYPGRYEDWLNERENVSGKRRFAFTPNQIVEFINKHYKLFPNSVSYPQELIDKIKNDTNNPERNIDMQDFYSLFRRWSLNVLYHYYK